MVAMDSLRVSSAQEALWLAQKLAPGLSNNIAAYLDISGDIAPSVMEARCGEWRTRLARYW